MGYQPPTPIPYVRQYFHGSPDRHSGRSHGGLAQNGNYVNYRDLIKYFIPSMIFVQLWPRDDQSAIMAKLDDGQKILTLAAKELEERRYRDFHGPG